MLSQGLLAPKKKVPQQSWYLLIAAFFAAKPVAA